MEKLKELKKIDLGNYEIKIKPKTAIEYGFYFAVNKEDQLKPILDIFNKFFEGYSIVNQLGYWKGISEKSFCLTIIENKEIDNRLIVYLREKIKEIGEQYEVLITSRVLNML